MLRDSGHLVALKPSLELLKGPFQPYSLSVTCNQTSMHCPLTKKPVAIILSERLSPDSSVKTSTVELGSGHLPFFALSFGHLLLSRSQSWDMSLRAEEGSVSHRHQEDTCAKQKEERWRSLTRCFPYKSLLRHQEEGYVRLGPHSVVTVSVQGISQCC